MPAIRNKGKNTKIINSSFQGFETAIENEGDNLKVEGGFFSGPNLKKHIREVKDLPIWLRYFLAAMTVLGTLGGLWGAYLTYEQTKSKKTVEPTSISVQEVFSKALTLETVVERQDYLEKYVGTEVNGHGVVSEVARSGQDAFLVDIKVPIHIGTDIQFTCQLFQESLSEKEALLLKGKPVYFSGVFSYVNINGHGLEIETCSLTRES